MAQRGGWTSIILAAVLGAGSAAALPGPGVALHDIGFPMRVLDLPSGMRVVLEEDHSQPLIAIIAVVDVGSSKDPLGKEGLAHLVEHLTFRAKPDGKIQRSNLLNFAAAGFWNAYTDRDVTTYITIGPREALNQLLALEGNRLLSPLAGLSPQAFEVERGVVSNEIAQRDEQGQLTAIQAHLFGALYPQGHPYHRAVAGTEASVATLTLADAEAFVHEHYLARNVTLYVSGDLNLAASDQVLDASLPPEFLQKPAAGPVPPPLRSGETASPVPALTSADKLEILRAPAERPMLYIAWSLPGGYGPTRYLERFARTAFSTAALGAARAGSDIEGLTTVLLEGRYANTLLCAASLKEGKNPERSLERVLDQLANIWMPGESNPSEVQAANRGFVRLQKEAIVGFALQTETITACRGQSDHHSLDRRPARLGQGPPVNLRVEQLQDGGLRL